MNHKLARLANVSSVALQIAVPAPNLTLEIPQSICTRSIRERSQNETE